MHERETTHWRGWCPRKRECYNYRVPGRAVLVEIVHVGGRPLRIG